VKKSSIKH